MCTHARTHVHTYVRTCVRTYAHISKEKALRKQLGDITADSGDEEASAPQGATSGSAAASSQGVAASSHSAAVGLVEASSHAGASSRAGAAAASSHSASAPTQHDLLAVKEEILQDSGEESVTEGEGQGSSWYISRRRQLWYGIWQELVRRRALRELLSQIKRQQRGELLLQQLSVEAGWNSSSISSIACEANSAQSSQSWRRSGSVGLVVEASGREASGHSFEAIPLRPGARP